jgi:hypothetical protein
MKYISGSRDQIMRRASRMLCQKKSMGKVSLIVG